MYLLRVFRDLD